MENEQADIDDFQKLTAAGLIWLSRKSHSYYGAIKRTEWRVH